MSDW
jgi:hypothetical protein